MCLWPRMVFWVAVPRSTKDELKKMRLWGVGKLPPTFLGGLTTSVNRLVLIQNKNLRQKLGSLRDFSRWQDVFFSSQLSVGLDIVLLRGDFFSVCDLCHNWGSM